MALRDEILASNAARELLTERAVAAALRGRGWVVREGRGGVARMSMGRHGRLTARVHLLFQCVGGGATLLFSEVPAVEAERPASFWFGEDDPAQRREIRAVLGDDFVKALHEKAYPRERAIVASARIKAQAARCRAASFRTVRGDGRNFSEALADLDQSVDRLRHDLLQQAIEDEADIHHVDLIHSMIVVDTTLWTLSHDERLSRRNSVRLLGDERWTDIVQSTRIAEALDTITRHYAEDV